MKKRVSRRFPLESQKTKGSSRCLLLCMIPIQNDSHIFPIFSPIVFLFFWEVHSYFFPIFYYFGVTQDVLLLNYISHSSRGAVDWWILGRFLHVQTPKGGELSICCSNLNLPKNRKRFLISPSLAVVFSKLPPNNKKNKQFKHFDVQTFLPSTYVCLSFPIGKMLGLLITTT